MNKILLPFKMVLVVACCVLSINTLSAATLYENFDNPSVAATNNNGVSITYNSGSWFSYGITKPTTPTENDRINGLYSIRMRGLDAKNSLYMQFDKAGAGTLSFVYGSYSNHSDGEFTIQKSTDGGSSWQTIGSPVTIPKWSGTFLTYSLDVNYSGNIRFKIVATLRSPNNPNQQFNIDDFMVTDYGTNQVAKPVSTISTGVYESSQTVVLSTSTNDASIYYTLDGSEPTALSNLYSIPLTVNSTTLVKAIATKSGYVDSRTENVLISFPEQISTLAELATKMAPSGTNLTYFKYTGEAVISHYYTTTTTAAYGNTVTKYAFLQDNTAGIALKDNNKNLSLNYNSGDKVTGIIAQVFNINNIAQLYPYADFSVISTGNVIVPETVASIAEAKTKPSQLVRINNLTFNGADGTKTFGVNNSVFFVENSVVTDFPLRIPSNLTVAPDYQGSVIPTTSVDIVGIVSKVETSFTNYSLFVRNAGELNLKETAVNELKVLTISVNDNVISFETLSPQLVKIYNINGQLVKSFVSITGENRVELRKGVFIIRISNQTAKILL